MPGRRDLPVRPDGHGTIGTHLEVKPVDHSPPTGYRWPTLLAVDRPGSLEVPA